MFDKEKEYEILREKYGFIPHEHRCEIEMVYGKRGLKEHCPFTKRQLKKGLYCQCDECTHMIFIVFEDNKQDKIKFIVRTIKENENE
jgi:hypothetical protein